MKHIQDHHFRWPLRPTKCGRLDSNNDVLVVAALESDCNDCRNVLMIGPLTQKGCGLKETVLDYTPEPYPDAETILDEVQKRRDGL